MMESSPSPPLVSVVTPFYNPADGLAECIESVLGQSYENFEYILHDNCSDDGSSEIAASWAAKDPRIRLIRADRFRGQVANYNQALSHISKQSRYCKIVQADDQLDPDCLKSMVELAEAHPRVGLVSSHYREGDRVRGTGLPAHETVLSGEEIIRRHLIDGIYLFGSPTTVLFRSEIVRQRQPFYAEDRLHEDTEACYEILHDWDFGFVHQVLSYLRVDPESTYGRMRRLDDPLLDGLITFHRYGPRFLSPGEFQHHRKKREERYYRRLARAVLLARGPEYWAYHRAGLATVGLKLQWGRVARAIPAELLSMATDPRETLHELKARIRWNH